MSDDAKTGGGDAAKDRRKARSQRASAVIESSAVDVTPEVVQTAAAEMPDGPAADAMPHAAEAGRQPEDRQTDVVAEEPQAVEPLTPESKVEEPQTAEPKMETPQAAAPDVSAAGPVPEAARADPVIVAPPPRSLAGPMAAAALVGGLLGTAGGTVVPGLLGMGKVTDPTAEIARLRQQVAALESRPAVAQGASVNLEPVNQRIAAIEAEAQKR
ncbi:MAG: hypothetical protein ACRC7G_14770, partial [Beijerinckiaceae bacterium]